MALGSCWTWSDYGGHEDRNWLLRKEESGIIAMGDSGEEFGDVSVVEHESAVDTVVVGEESVDSEA